MPSALIRAGFVVFILAFVFYFFSHVILVTALIAGLGFVIFIGGVVLLSLESPGDINFS